MQLPEIIGQPQYQETPSGAPSDIYKKRMNDSMLIAEIIPYDPTIDNHLNYVKGEAAWGEFTTYLNGNGVTLSSQPIKVAINHIAPITESFGNDFSPSEILSGLNNITSGTVQELNYLSGDKWHNFAGNTYKDLINNSKNAGGIIGKAGEFIGGIEEKLAGLGEHGDTVVNFLHSAVSNVARKMDVPAVWRGNSQSISYDLNIRLDCFNAASNTSYGKYIIACIIALKHFVCPRTDDQDLARYKWPFLMEFKIPGLCHIPLAFCSNMSVVKGGDVNDVQWITQRPNIVDVRMTICPVHNIQLNAKTGFLSDGRFTISDDSEIMGTKPSYKPKSSSSTADSTVLSAFNDTNYNNLDSMINNLTGGNGTTDQRTQQSDQSIKASNALNKAIV